MKRRTGIFFLMIFLLWAKEGGAQEVIVKLGTLAPPGSPWHDVLREMGNQWQRISQGRVEVRIFPGGVAGDEPDMLRKLRVGQLNAVAVTSGWLGSIEPALQALQIPLAVSSYEELDYVRDHLAGRFEALMEKKGYVVLNWADAGWVVFFAKRPVTRVAEMQSMKLFAWAGNPKSLALWREAGFHPVPLATTDIMLSLQSGLIDAFNATAIAALSFQWFSLAPYMIDLRWAPLVGATAVTKKAWEEIPAEIRPAFKKAAHEAGDRVRGEIRKLEQQAIQAMTKRGLKVVRVPSEVMGEWRQVAEKAYPRLQNDLVPPEYFKEVFRLRDEYRAKRTSLPSVNR